MTAVESCTGGWIAKCCTDRPGSSAWFEGGLVTYSNTSKVTLASVPAALIEQHGAVSEPVARAMALGGARALGAEVSVAVTGIAGPGGGSAEKPVGLVCFAWRLADRIISDTRRFDGDRNAIRHQSVIHALQGVVDQLSSA